VSHTCIWCTHEKPESSFNVEHVIPQAFGTFEQNFTLIKTVCADCNSFFSRELEPWLARDTLEGFERYQHGHKATTDFKSMGPKSTARIQLAEGPYAGAWAFAVPGYEQLGARAFPQVGFALQSSGPFEWFPLRDLPTKETLKAKGYVGEVHLRFCECSDMDLALRLLAEKGIPAGATTKFEPPSGPLKMDHVFRPELIHRRGLAKIALNYVAHQAGKVTALESRFDPIRELVMVGKEPDRPYFEIDGGPIIHGDKVDTRWDGHILVVETRGPYVQAIVSLYNRLRHGLRLTWMSGAPVGPFGHYFDVPTRTIVPMAPSSKSEGTRS
jgi:hypothetical protein